MKKYLKKIGLALALIMVVIQFIPTTRNESTEVLNTDLMQAYNVAEPIAKKLQASCYDCHSNNTVYPWYNKIQPVSWVLEHHIQEAKEELNFSEFASYSISKQKDKLEEMIEEIEEDEMPLKAYKLMHSNAKFSAKEKEEILSYLHQLEESL